MVAAGFGAPSVRTFLMGEGPWRARWREAHSQAQERPPRGGIRGRQEASLWPGGREPHQAQAGGQGCRTGRSPTAVRKPMAQMRQAGGGKEARLAPGGLMGAAKRCVSQLRGEARHERSAETMVLGSTSEPRGRAGPSAAQAEGMRPGPRAKGGDLRGREGKGKGTRNTRRSRPRSPAGNRHPASAVVRAAARRTELRLQA